MKRLCSVIAVLLTFLCAASVALADTTGYSYVEVTDDYGNTITIEVTEGEQVEEANAELEDPTPTPAPPQPAATAAPNAEPRTQNDNTPQSTPANGPVVVSEGGGVAYSGGNGNGNGGTGSVVIANGGGVTYSDGNNGADDPDGNVVISNGGNDGAGEVPETPAPIVEQVREMLPESVRQALATEVDEAGVPVVSSKTVILLLVIILVLLLIVAAGIVLAIVLTVSRRRHSGENAVSKSNRDMSGHADANRPKGKIRQTSAGASEVDETEDQKEK